MVNYITIRALEPFLSRPREQLHLADIARSIKTPHPTVRLWLSALESEGIVKKSFKGRLTLFALNLEHPNIIDQLALAERMHWLHRCDEEPALRELASIARGLPEGTSIVIFGSATTSLRNAADIDILVTGQTAEKEMKQLRLLGKRTHIVSVPSLGKVSATLRKEIQSKRLVVQGTDDVLRWILWSNSGGAGNAASR